jgi:hypothetical protein
MSIIRIEKFPKSLENGSQTTPVQKNRASFIMKFAPLGQHVPGC